MKPYKYAAILALLTLAISLTLTYSSRWERTRDFLARRKAPAAILPPSYGHGLRIVQFYASPGQIFVGQSSLVCYSTENAKVVKLDPPVENVAPSFNRCFEVRPVESTSYKLEAQDEQGHSVNAGFRIEVRPAPPELTLWTTSATTLRRGDRFTICYGLRHVASARLEPIGWDVKVSERECVMTYPSASLELRLEAKGTEGSKLVQKVKVTVTP